MKQDEFNQFIREYLERRPTSKVRDIYKLLYQGVFGVGHIMGQNAYPRLVEEANRIHKDDYPDEPMVEPASVDGEMIRVNLRPFMRMNGDLDKLYTTMVESSKTEGSPEVFLTLWGWFKELVETDGYKFDRQTIQSYDSELAAEGPRPKHHTEPYREAYYPAYRVVSRALFRETAEP